MEIGNAKNTKAQNLNNKIAEKAHQIYQDRIKQGHSGDHNGDWIQAEKQVLSASALPSTKELMKVP